MGEKITYICATLGEVPDDATIILESICLENGTFTGRAGQISKNRSTASILQISLLLAKTFILLVQWKPGI